MPPSPTNIDYIIDGENRRVGKQLNTAVTAGFLYQDALNVVAQLDGSGNLVARYVFGTKPNLPDYFTSAAGIFRILSDYLGSPRVIVNTSTGVIAERIDYDEFGKVTSPPGPGLTPFGFAGGLYDKDTGLVRFGARDYDPSVGRWTAKDQTRFDGGMNIYAYGANDPINRVDPKGTGPWGCVAAIVTCGASIIYGTVGLANDLKECKKKVEEAQKKIDGCPPDDPRHDAFSRFDVMRDCVFDALKSDTIGQVFDAACVVSLAVCGLTPL